MLRFLILTGKRSLWSQNCLQTLRGHTDTIVLAQLLNVIAGLEIYNFILARTGEQYELKVDTLYPAISGWEGRIRYVLLGR